MAFLLREAGGFDGLFRIGEALPVDDFAVTQPVELCVALVPIRRPVSLRPISRNTRMTWSPPASMNCSGSILQSSHISAHRIACSTIAPCPRATVPSGRFVPSHSMSGSQNDRPLPGSSPRNAFHIRRTISTFSRDITGSIGDPVRAAAGRSPAPVGPLRVNSTFWNPWAGRRGTGRQAGWMFLLWWKALSGS